MGLPVIFDTDITPSTASGFCPMKMNGRAAGCEICPNLEDVDSRVAAYEGLGERIPFDPSIFSFRVGGRYSEGACAFTAAAALMQAFGALFYDPQEDRLSDKPDELIVMAREFLSLANKP